MRKLFCKFLCILVCINDHSQTFFFLFQSIHQITAAIGEHNSFCIITVNDIVERNRHSDPSPSFFFSSTFFSLSFIPGGKIEEKTTASTIY